mgnify:CR=1 FL=1
MNENILTDEEVRQRVEAIDSWEYIGEALRVKNHPGTLGDAYFGSLGERINVLIFEDRWFSNGPRRCYRLRLCLGRETLYEQLSHGHPETIAHKLFFEVQEKYNNQ